MVIVGWVFFRSDTMLYCIGMLRAMSGGAVFSDGRTEYCLRMYGWVLLISIVAAMPVKNWLSNFPDKHKSNRLLSFVQNWAPGCLALVLLAFSYMELLSSTFNPFIYFRF